MMPLASLLGSCPHSVTSPKWVVHFQVLILRWMGLCIFSDPMGLSSELSCEAGSFSHCLNPNRFLQPEVLRLYFPALWSWVVCFVSLLSCSSRLICTQMWEIPSANLCLPCSTSSRLATCPLHPGFPSPPLLPIWMNVSSLTPWLSDFHAVWFSGSSWIYL